MTSYFVVHIDRNTYFDIFKEFINNLFFMQFCVLLQDMKIERNKYEYNDESFNKHERNWNKNDPNGNYVVR